MVVVVEESELVVVVGSLPVVGGSALVEVGSERMEGVGET